MARQASSRSPFIDSHGVELSPKQYTPYSFNGHLHHGLNRHTNQTPFSPLSSFIQQSSATHQVQSTPPYLLCHCGCTDHRMNRDRSMLHSLLCVTMGFGVWGGSFVKFPVSQQHGRSWCNLDNHVITLIRRICVDWRSQKTSGFPDSQTCVLSKSRDSRHFWKTHRSSRSLASS